MEDDHHWRPRASWATLRARARIMQATRAFFRARGVLEVDVPVLQGGANLDHGVESFRVETAAGPRFLPTSPEHPLKRLVAAGSGPVWALAPAFRRGESGLRHRPEFRMLEWYRPGWDDGALSEECVELLAALTGLAPKVERVSWREAFVRYAGLDPATADDAALRAALGEHRATPQGRAEALDLLLALHIEPALGCGQWTILIDYPATAAAQARVRMDAQGQPIAARFEIYRNGLELANGYHELTDASVLRERLEHERLLRSDATQLLHDERFAAAMHEGLGDCAGVAVGFDRVLMIALDRTDIAETMAFPYEEA